MTTVPVTRGPFLLRPVTAASVPLIPGVPLEGSLRAALAGEAGMRGRGTAGGRRAYRVPLPRSVAALRAPGASSSAVNFAPRCAYACRGSSAVWAGCAFPVVSISRPPTRHPGPSPRPAVRGIVRDTPPPDSATSPDAPECCPAWRVNARIVPGHRRSSCHWLCPPGRGPSTVGADWRQPVRLCHHQAHTASLERGASGGFA